MACVRIEGEISGNSPYITKLFIEMILMLTWLKSVSKPFFIVLVGFIVLTRFQGCQYIAAYSGAGFAANLPDATSIAKPISCNTQALQVMSYNVRYGSTTIEAVANRFRGGDTGDGYLPWSVRIPEIRARIASYAPDLLGLQEMETDADIGGIVPLDTYTLVTYHLGSFQYGDSALLFKTSRFEKLDSGQMWLGHTPDLPMSLGFSRLAMIRYVNWVMLREKSTGFTFMFVNTHFDNASKNKEPSATLFRERIASLTKGLPMIVSGDFNTTAGNERYRRLMGSDENPPLLINSFALFNGQIGNQASHPNKLIDHILVGGPCKTEVEQWLVDTRQLKNGQRMSDHNPIFARLRFTS
ncbi:endonuclease/exonuclease/phosphatase family protein [Methyloglobulus morosus KoM1]|uniref:Endonuclease/exonuclease/phosphatase family protein n=2 Tax=Methyloglobulus TaxID=1410680 RepID=V5BVN9_9GAMM|nr:endonuclease/exonuclease/phosphatase family protein [Methyloglobulus morosus KoM1]